MLSILLVSAALASWFTETNEGETCGLDSSNYYAIAGALGVDSIVITPTITGTITWATGTDYVWHVTPAGGVAFDIPTENPNGWSTTVKIVPTAEHLAKLAGVASATIQLYKGAEQCIKGTGDDPKATLTLPGFEESTAPALSAVSTAGVSTVTFTLAGVDVGTAGSKVGDLHIAGKTYEVKGKTAGTPGLLSFELPLADLAAVNDDTTYGYFVNGADMTTLHTMIKFGLAESTVGAPKHKDGTTATVNFDKTSHTLFGAKVDSAAAEIAQTTNDADITVADLETGMFFYGVDTSTKLIPTGVPVTYKLTKLPTPTLALGVPASGQTATGAPVFEYGFDSAVPAHLTLALATPEAFVANSTNTSKLQLIVHKVVSATAPVVVATSGVYGTDNTLAYLPSTLTAGTCTITKGTKTGTVQAVNAVFGAGYFLAAPQGIVVYEKATTPDYSKSTFHAFTYDAADKTKATASVETKDFDTTKTYEAYVVETYTPSATAPVKATSAAAVQIAGPETPATGAFTTVASTFVALVALLLALF